MNIFTERQWEVWNLMLERRTHGQIARGLGISTRNVMQRITQIWDRMCMNPEVYPELIQQLLKGKEQ